LSFSGPTVMPMRCREPRAQ